MNELHCGESERDWLAEIYGDDSETYYRYMASDAPSRSCMLPDGHDGPHVWTSDEDITVRLK